MPVVYKYMIFELVEKKPKTTVWRIINKCSGCTIGTIKWYGQWRQYCFFPAQDCVFSSGCLSDIIDFMKGLRI
jgi:hypothetical protein